MVGFDPASIEDLDKPPPKLPNPAIAINPLVTVLDDFFPPIIEQFTDFDFTGDFEMSIEGENPCCPDVSEAIKSVEVRDIFKGTGDGNPFVEAAVPGEMDTFGSQIEDGMEKVSLIGALETSFPISIKTENMAEFEMPIEGEKNPCCHDVSEAIKSVEVRDIFKGTGDGNPFVEVAVPVELDTFGSQIEEGMEKVSLIGALETSVPISIKSENMAELDEKESDGFVAVAQSVTEETDVIVKTEMGFKVSSDINLEKPEENYGDENDSSSESESEVSSSSSSSCSEEEKEEEEDERDMGVVGEMEEGEIGDLEGNGIAADSDDEVDEGVTRGPIKSKNELQILLPVPQVDVALEPHHRTMPVGVISSIMGTKIIIEGLEKHNPLNEGSIIWITKTRLPLGLVDEIFGPVKNPYYVVRYNSDEEVPAGLNEGTPVSFVEDFANHVLNDKSVYKKGYDASGENDEEVSDEFEFSDDEKEAEYRRSQRMAKRGADDRKRGNRDFIDRKKAQQKGEFQKKNHLPVPPGPPPPRDGRPPGIPNQSHTSSVAAVGCDGFACTHGTGPGTASMSTFVPSVSQVGQATYCMPQNLLALNNGVWTNGMPSPQQHQHQHQHAVFPNGFPYNGLPSQQQNVPLPLGQPFQHLHPLYMNLPNGIPVRQQFDPSQMLLPNVALPYGQPNFTARPLSTTWTGIVGHPGFSHATLGMDFNGQPVHSSMNSGEQGVLSSRLSNQQSNGMQSPTVTQGSFASPQQFHQGVFSTRGKKPYRRGDGNFAGGRGRRQSG